ncbi:hypothetical protein [Streptomyces yunnanensis]|uniref:Uncharacterized protein n=1 Tax=Streptomyces yunnanensis TaxID=156453 RepID=A0A9X8QX30_9ACTN|nr:hypothetical protein [Streptomyces yunnanensis]SHM77727.1 hypothetical protein SAMN05216268_11485 [Streptomyces yunnanensis]
MRVLSRLMRTAAPARIRPSSPHGIAGQAGGGRVSRAGTRRLVVWGLLSVALALIGWMVILGLTLKSHARVRHWDTAWVGLDAMEVVGLLLTGALTWYRRTAVGPIASATAMLFALDAWFDVTTAAKGSDHLTAVAMAVCCELPLAIGLVLISVLAARWKASPALLTEGRGAPHAPDHGPCSGDGQRREPGIGRAMTGDACSLRPRRAPEQTGP